MALLYSKSKTEWIQNHNISSSTKIKYCLAFSQINAPMQGDVRFGSFTAASSIVVDICGIAEINCIDLALRKGMIITSVVTYHILFIQMNNGLLHFIPLWEVQPMQSFLARLLRTCLAQSCRFFTQISCMMRNILQESCILQGFWPLSCKILQNILQESCMALFARF